MTPDNSVHSYEDVMFPPGTKVKARVTIQSDDRTNGLECSAPVFPPGTEGVVVCRSIDQQRDHDVTLKPGAENCLVVEFVGGYRYDCSPDEIEVLLQTPSKLLDVARELLDRLDIVRLRGYVGHDLINRLREAVYEEERGM